MPRVLIAIACLFALGLARPAASDVYVSDTVSMFVPGGAQEIGPSRYVYARLPSPGRAHYRVTANASGLLRVLLCDSRNFELLRQEKPHRCRQKKRKGRFSVTTPAALAGPVYAVVKNENVLVGKRASWRTQIVFPATDGFKRKVKEHLGAIMESLHDTLRFPAFDLTVTPCGQVNAFSVRRNGDITLCTEMMLDAVQDGNTAAFMMNLFHELGHTLLNLWGEPNNGNERTADEFATILALISEKPGFVRDWIRWFRENENLAGEIRAARDGDLHMLTPQRVEAIQQILERPEPTIRRWTRTIYPHMTDAGLRKVLRGGHPGDNPDLARQILQDRLAK